MLRSFVTCCCLLLANSLACRAAVVVYLDEQGGLFGYARPEVNDPVSALLALAAPPPASETGQNLASGVLPGTKVLAIQTEGDTTTVDFSVEIIGGGLDEVRLMAIFQQAKATLRQFGLTGSIRLQAAGKLLSDYLAPVKRAEPNAPPRIMAPKATGLAGRSIALSPGHGYFWNGSGWYTQRPVYCSPLNQEDFHNLEEMQYLNTYLTQDGATTKPYRCLDKSYGNHSSGHPWWQMGGYLWVQHLGFPCSIYASSTGDCTTGSGASESSDDVRARPLASDSDNTDIYVSLHSNGYTGDCTGSCPTGSETYYDNSSEHASWGAISQTLANNINSAIMSAITANADPTWTCHGTCVKDSAGSYGEIRIPNRAATLTELAFHDTCDRDADANHLRDNFFRSTAMWGMYKGICDYFGVAPTWAFYSDEVVSNDIPVSMTPGSIATVHITFRNRGVLWNDARQFRLGAVGDSDPFAATTRYNVGGEVGPNTAKTFTLTFTAPTTPGTYTTDWRMLREGVTWFGQTLTVNVTVSGVAGAPNIIAQPQSQAVAPGSTVNLTVVATGSAPLSYQWRKNTVNLGNGGNIFGATTATLTITNVQSADAANYSVVVSNTNGATTSLEATLTVGLPGISIGSYSIESGNMDSTSRSSAYVQFSTCGLTGWYSYGVPGPSGSNCTVFNRDIRWLPTLPTYGFSGRGYLTASAIVPDNHATATAKFYAVDGSGTDLAGPITGSINECAYSCAWVTFYSGNVNVSSFGGWRSNTQNDGPPGAGGCSITCGSFPAGYSQMHIQAARWHYLDDWTCLGGYGSTNVSDTSGRAFAWGESGLYLYPAVDTSHGGGIIADMGLSGKTPGRVTAGDCNNANTLDFKGNANGYGGGDNMDAYGFAWVFAPSGAGPRYLIGSDDGNRLWVNGILINSTNASRGLTRDQDNTGSVSLPAGWSRVLFKVHNFTGTFQGTVSLRNGGDSNLNEPSVRVFDLGGYYSYGVAYEQDAWYPLVYATNFYGGGNPQPNNNYYGNKPTVTASGTAASGSPVPFWKVMHYEWGYGLAGDTDYDDVSSSGASWSHTQTDVTGHRRFHFFAVSRSGRTSFQNNGQTGGSNWGGAGAGTYMDVYIDDEAPQPPSFSSATAASTSEIDLAWTSPLDQGVGIDPGATEAADETGNSSTNYYRVGDVGVQVYRNGSVISSWGTGSGANDTGLAANTPCTYTLEARDNTSEGRGTWHNSTGQQGSTTVWTLSVPPGSGSVTADQASPGVGSNVTWIAVNGFGPGKVQYYRYAWDTASTHTWTDTETQWSSGSIMTVPGSAGAWYLHVKGYNGADVGNGTFDYSVTVTSSQTNAVVGITENLDGTFTLTFVGTPQAQYYVVSQTNPAEPLANWAVVVGSTNTVTNSSGLWSVTVSNTAPQMFYRSVGITPGP